ncbi:MAG: c-type cytochrome [Phycisphaerae bacterium]
MKSRSCMFSLLSACLGLGALSGMTCPGGGTTLPAEFTSADGLKGGIAYDKFWATETGHSGDFSTADTTTLNNFADFFRCKQCHAWDQLGRAASYIDRAPNTTRPNVAPINLASVIASKTEQELFDEIKTGGSATRRSLSADLSTYDPTTNNTVGDQMPNFGSFMTDSQIWEIVKFLKTERFDTTMLYDITTTGTYSTGSRTFSNVGKDGNAVTGAVLYVSKSCSGCHGTDGKTLTPLGGKTGLGQFARDKPYELQHKGHFGQLGTAMASRAFTQTEMKDLLKALSDTTAFPD